MCARIGEKNDFGFCADDGNLEDMEKERVSLLKTCEIKSAGLNFTMTNRKCSIITCILHRYIFLKLLS